MAKIGILHPGEMGISIAASAIRGGHHVFWLSENRSDQTRQRAVKENLVEIQLVSKFCQTCETIISVCPPHAAEDVAKLVVEGRFRGFYLDANAISPQRAARLGEMLGANDIRFIDGSIIGGPARTRGETQLYLSGKDAGRITDYFASGPLETIIIGNEIGKASALKMCYAAHSKGITALLASILAAANSLGVRNELCERWNVDDSGFSEQINHRVLRAAGKAWRFEGEMEEIASTFDEAGLPNGFHKAAAEIYHRVANLKNNNSTLSIDEILAAVSGRTA